MKPKFKRKHRRLFRARAYSNTWQITFWVMLVVLVSISASIWFFLRSLYLPELRSHARYLATELNQVIAAKEHWKDQPDVLRWLQSNNHIKLVEDEAQFPVVQDKALVSIFTNILATEISEHIGRDATVYFKFKPIPNLWVQDSAHPEFWIREPVSYYADYSPGSLLFFLIGTPIFTLITVLLLVRQLHRPLRKLQQAATNYIRQDSATTLPTRTGPIEIRQVNMAFNRLFTTLSQAQKERTIMLAGISHDLRTPLTRMRLTAEMLPDEFLREGLIYDVEDMDAILEQFISFMKDGSDEPIRLTDLDAIINEITIQFASVPFVHDSKAMVLVPVRPLSIKRMIINLVNNAIRYGKPPIYISTTIESVAPTEGYLDDIEHEDTGVTVDQEVQQAADTRLVICVRDCGDGVPHAQLKRIMQPFERGESARTTQGSGLGLAIVGRIAALHNGTVSAYNHSDGGFEVCVRIPLLTQSLSKVEKTIPDE